MQYNDVKELISIFEASDLTELEVNLDNLSLRLNRGPVKQTAVQTSAEGAVQSAVMPATQTSVQNVAQTAAQNIVQPAASATPVTAPATESTAAVSQPVPAAKEGTVITAPLVGTFYAGSSPDKPPFVNVGDKVSKGDVVCIVEAMKFMNEIKSDVTGTVAEILVADGDFVEYGQELIRIV